MRNFRSRYTFILTLIISSASMAAPPQVILIDSAGLSRSNGDTVIEQDLKKLTNDYGVTITDKILAGYILDRNDRGDRSYTGFDVTAKYANPFFAKYFHNPSPDEKDSQQQANSMWAYATKGTKPTQPFDKAYSAVALTEIDHVYFGSTKFGEGYYVPKKGKATDFGFESVLHEALHIWHSHHSKNVSELLHSKGSYYDRVEQSNKLCPNFKKVTQDYDMGEQKPVCGFKNRQDAIIAVLKKTKWPQRYGSQTDRKHGLVKKGQECSQDPSYVEKINSDLICFSNGYGETVGDLHPIDNDMEYFAILMQLSIFSPKDFSLIATEKEKTFAKELFLNDFRDHTDRSARTSHKSGSVQ